ncbi:MAG TPA: hypothetical protein VIV61_11575 [Candidatus Ozemobacteraceae bacterium]
MQRINRRGIIGFMVTLALGVALGAATLVVGTEVAKNVKEKKSGDKTAVSTPKSGGANANPAAAAAWDEYQKARKAYAEARAANAPDAEQKKADVKRLRDAWKRAVFEDLPGAVSDAVKNPFTGGEVEVDPTPTTGNRPPSPPVALPTPGSGSASSLNLKPLTTPDGVTLDYYAVRSGDSLEAICQRYYGDKGMWAHIISYQSPCIAATPNLIFPGQIIALPRGITKPATTTATTGKPGAYPVAPAGDESWADTFQKNYVVSDRVLTNTDTMTVAQIQSFLDAKGSCLAKPYNGSTPAQMIYDAAKKHGINPQVLLTRLQCEQGLISKKTATQKQLDWALGVGCYDSGNWNTKFKGLDKQIEWAAQTYRRHYDDAKAKIDRGEKVTMTIDGESVTMKNAASYAFYKYCPHFQGNKLFFDVWRGYRKSWP